MKNKICCIYIITNRATKGFYIGSTVDFEKRIKEHKRKLRKNCHHSRYLQNSYNFHGPDAFDYDVFQFCSKEGRLELESYYLKLYVPRYNVSLSAYCPMEGRKHSKETINKFKNRLVTRGEENPNWGRKHSQEFKEAKRLARLGYKHKDSTKKNERNCNKNRSNN